MNMKITTSSGGVNVNDTASTTTRRPNNVKKIPNDITIPLPQSEILERFVKVLTVLFNTIVVITVLAIFGFIQYNDFTKLAVGWEMPPRDVAPFSALAIGFSFLFELPPSMVLAFDDEAFMQLHNFIQLPRTVWFMAGLASSFVAQVTLEVVLTTIVRYCMFIWAVMRCLLQG